MGLLGLIILGVGFISLIVGMAMLIGGSVSGEISDKERPKIRKWGAILLVVAFLLFFSSSFYVVVDAGTVGVQKTFGIVDDKVMQPGLHLKNPFTEVIPMSTRTMKYMDYGTTDVATIKALSNDGLETTMGIAVNYHINGAKVTEVYKQVGTNYDTVVMVNPIHSVPRDMISKYDTKTLYSASQEGTTDRAKLERELHEGIQARLNELGVPDSIIIEQASIRIIDFDQVYKTSISNKMKMDTEIQEKEKEVQKQVMEAKRIAAEAEGNANKDRIAAQGKADAARIEAQGVKDAADKIGQVSPQYLSWYFMQTMKDNPKAIYIPVDVNGLPIIKTV
jgi:regulator of protease activity HflC (stomatin/prohibitin superfamily)